MGSYVPMCKADGRYEEVQCEGTTAHCWCVNVHGEELLGTRTTGTLKCPNLSKHRFPNFSERERERERECVCVCLCVCVAQRSQCKDVMQMYHVSSESAETTGTLCLASHENNQTFVNQTDMRRPG